MFTAWRILALASTTRVLAQAWFRTDADCLDYLESAVARRLRLSDCGHEGGWRLGDGRFIRRVFDTQFEWRPVYVGRGHP